MGFWSWDNFLGCYGHIVIMFLRYSVFLWPFLKVSHPEPQGSNKQLYKFMQSINHFRKSASSFMSAQMHHILLFNKTCYSRFFSKRLHEPKKKKKACFSQSHWPNSMFLKIVAPFRWVWTFEKKNKLVVLINTRAIICSHRFQNTWQGICSPNLDLKNG